MILKVCSAVELRFNQESMIMVLQREMKARLMQIEVSEIIYLAVSVVYEGEYYFKKMRVKLAQWSGKVQ